MNRRHAVEPVYEITATRRGLTEDIHGRARRYMITMGIRSLCFPAAVLTEGWLRWTLMLGALAIPYFAVVVANGGREPTGRTPATLVMTVPRPALGSAPRATVPHDDAA